MARGASFHICSDELTLLSNRLDRKITSMTARPQPRLGVDRRDVRFRAVDGGAIPAQPTHQIGGHLALDLCNPAGERLAEQPDLLCDWESIMRWAIRVGLIPPESYLAGLRLPGGVDSFVQLRQAIYRIGPAVVGKRSVPQRDLASIRKQANVPGRTSRFVATASTWRPGPSESAARSCARS